MTKQKKSFKDNISPAMQLPVMNYITVPDSHDEERKDEDTTTQNENKPPVGYKKNPEFIETRSKRQQILLQPSLYERIKAKYEAGEGSSINDIIHKALEKAFPEN